MEKVHSQSGNNNMGTAVTALAAIKSCFLLDKVQWTFVQTPIITVTIKKMRMVAGDWQQ